MKSWSSIVSGNVSSSTQNTPVQKPNEEFPALVVSQKIEHEPVEQKIIYTEVKKDQEFKPVRPRRTKKLQDSPRQEPNESQEPKSSKDKTFSDRLEVEKKRYLDKYKQEKDKLCFEFIKGDLFSVGSDVSLAHCVSEDFKMNKGIATEFKKRFGQVDALLDQGIKSGGVAHIKHENRYVFYMVTKKFFYFKPYYSALEKSIKELCKLCLRLNVTKLAMPMIGSGLDQLEWSIVSKIIDDTFSKSNIQLYIYKFERKQVGASKSE